MSIYHFLKLLQSCKVQKAFNPSTICISSYGTGELSIGPFLLKWSVGNAAPLAGEAYNGSLLSYCKCSVFMVGGMVPALGKVPYFACKHE